MLLGEVILGFNGANAEEVMYKMSENVTFGKNQLIGITELQRNASAVLSKAKEKDVLVLKNNAPYAVIIDCDRYEKLMDMVEQADIAAMLLERKSNSEWLSTEDVFAGLSLFEPGGKTEYEPRRPKTADKMGLYTLGKL